MEKSKKTVRDVFNELTEEEKQVVYFLIGKEYFDEDAKENDEEWRL